MQVATRIWSAGRRATRGTFASLAVRDFRLLWGGLVVLFGATQIRMVASGYLAYELTNSPLLLSFVAVGYAYRAAAIMTTATNSSITVARR